MGIYRVVILGVVLVCQRLKPHFLDLYDQMPFCSLLFFVFQGFTYVAPSVLESVKEKFSFEPKIRSPRRFIGSPRTPVRYSDFVVLTVFLSFFFFF